jgi:hypothetical protein
MNLRTIFSKSQILVCTLLLAWIAIGEVVMHTFHLPTWPLFLSMVAFFLAEQHIKEIPKIIVGGAFGIVNFFVLVKFWLPATTGMLEVFPAQVIYILIFVGSIVILGPVLPYLLNSFTFLYFLVAAMDKAFDPATCVAVTLIGGAIIIAGCVGSARLVVFLCVPPQTSDS